jgi:hypothetical protein
LHVIEAHKLVGLRSGREADFSPGSARLPRDGKATEQTAARIHSWAVYHLKGTLAKFVGIIDSAPDEKTAIDRAIVEYHVRLNKRAADFTPPTHFCAITIL